MKKVWKLLEENPESLVYKWNGQTGKGKKFTIFRREYNWWYGAQLEGAERIDLGDDWSGSVLQVANLLGLS